MGLLCDHTDFTFWSHVDPETPNRPLCGGFESSACLLPDQFGLTDCAGAEPAASTSDELLLFVRGSDRSLD